MDNRDIMRGLGDMKYSLEEFEKYAPLDILVPMASKKQRGYIHGLCKSLNIDEEDFFEIPVKEMSVGEAKDAINELLEAKKNKDFGLFKKNQMIRFRASSYDDDDELPF